VLALPCDVTDPGDVTGFVAAAAAALGGLDILVNNAGGARPGRFAAVTDEDWQRRLLAANESKDPYPERKVATPRSRPETGQDLGLARAADR
jgi:hypothetical protein